MPTDSNINIQSDSLLPTVKLTEYSDEINITVSRARLAVMMVANTEYVSFIRGELCVSLSTAFLKSLDGERPSNDTIPSITKPNLPQEESLTETTKHYSDNIIPVIVVGFISLIVACGILA